MILISYRSLRNKGEVILMMEMVKCNRNSLVSKGLRLFAISYRNYVLVILEWYLSARGQIVLDD